MSNATPAGRLRRTNLPLCLWVHQSNVANVDLDCRLWETGKGDKLWGQDKWNVGMPYGSFKELGEVLAGRTEYALPNHICDYDWYEVLLSCGTIQEGQIEQLAIQSHGAPGAVDVDNEVGEAMTAEISAHKNPQYLNCTTFERYASTLDAIQRAVSRGGYVYFMSCKTAGNALGEPMGDEFLIELSKRWSKKKITVVAYTCILFQANGPNIQKSARGNFAGVRESGYASSGLRGAQRQYVFRIFWANLAQLPWASSSSVHATCAREGKIIRRGKPATNQWGEHGEAKTTPLWPPDEEWYTWGKWNTGSPPTSQAPQGYGPIIFP